MLPIHIRAARTLTTVGLIVILLGAGLVTATDSSAKTVRPARGSSAPAFATAVLAALNTERAAHRLPRLRLNRRLTTTAAAHARMMATTDTLATKCPGEASYANRISHAGYDAIAIGENVGWNGDMTKTGALYLARQMYRGLAPNQGERRIVLDRRFTDVGIDVYLDKVGGKLWLTEDFVDVPRR